MPEAEWPPCGSPTTVCSVGEWRSRRCTPTSPSDENLRGRFRQEAVAAAALSHPNIVATYDTGDDDGTAFIVMELVEGESLRQLLDRRGSLDPAPSVAIVRQVAAALEHAHRNGIIHRDIKPANVLVPREGPVKVTDFGIAKATGSADFTRTGMVVGTARYLSPEQVQGLPTDARTDVYALGLVLYEMLAGQPAYQGDTEMATAVSRMSGPPPPLASIRPAVPAGLVTIVDHALELDPDRRIPSAAAFEEALERGPGALRPRPAAPAQPARRGVRAAAAPRPARPPVRGQNTKTNKKPAKKRGGWVKVMLFLLLLAVFGVAAGLITAQILEDDTGGGGGGGRVRRDGARHHRDPRLRPPRGRRRELRPQSALPSTVISTRPGAASSTRTPASSAAARPASASRSTCRSSPRVSAVSIDGEPGASVEIYVSDTSHRHARRLGPRPGDCRRPPCVRHARPSTRPSTDGWCSSGSRCCPSRANSWSESCVSPDSSHQHGTARPGRSMTTRWPSPLEPATARALERLLHQHTDRIHAVCRRIVGHPEDALDATQEAMIAIARGITRFDGQSRVSTWIYRVATNAALDEVRRQRRRPVPAEPPTATRADGDITDAVDARLDIDAALATLPADYPGRGGAA